MGTDLTRIPPHAVDAEQAALGAMLLNDASRMTGIAMIGCRPVWYREDHRLIYAALVRMHERNAVVNTVTLRDELERTKQIDAVGGVAYLVQLAESVPNSEECTSHCEIVLRHWAKRECIHICRRAALDAYEPGTEPEEVLTVAATNLDGVSASLAETHERPLIEEIADALSQADGEAGPGYETGWWNLDALFPNGGMLATRLWTIGARTSQGKTELCCQMILHFARQGARPHFISLEEPVASIYSRMACTISASLADEGGSSGLHNAGFDRTRIAEQLSEIRVSKGSPNVGSIVAQMGASIRKENRNVFYVDYLQCVRPTTASRSGNRHQEITDVIMRFRDFTVEHDVMLLVPSQLRRGEGDADTRRPHMADLKESGSIEEASHGILLIHCPIASTASRDMEIIVAKQRGGATGSAKFVCDFAQHTMRPVDPNKETDVVVTDYEPEPPDCGGVPF